MIRIFPTLIDSYHYYLQSEMPLQDMIDRINRVPQPKTEAAARGSALNDTVDALILGHDVYTQNGSYLAESDGMQFEFDRQLVDHLAEHFTGALTQVYTEGEISTNYGIVMLYGYVDYIVRNVAFDLKSTGRYTWPKYKDSVQWKSYLYTLKAQGAQVDTFEYVVTDFNGIYRESYPLNERTTDLLRADVNGFLQFAYNHRHLITNPKIQL